MIYPIELAADDNGTILVTCRAFPEMTTIGESRDDARRHAVGAIEEAIAARIAHGDPLPGQLGEAEVRDAQEWVKLPALTSLKAALYAALRESGMSRAELGRQLGRHREQVDRLFRLDHASRLDQLEAAFAKLHKGVEISVRKKV